MPSKIISHQFLCSPNLIIAVFLPCLQKSMTRYKLFSPRHIKDSVVTVVKERENDKRFYLLSYMSVLVLAMLAFSGLGAVHYNFVRTRFHWEVSSCYSLLPVRYMVSRNIIYSTFPSFALFEVTCYKRDQKLVLKMF